MSEDTIPTDTFGARLAIVRQHMGGWNVKRAADACGIDNQRWHNWESGRNQPRDYERVCRRISERLGVSLLWLMIGGPLTPPSTKWYSPPVAA